MSETENLTAYRRMIAIVAVVIGLIFSYLIVKPFLVAIIGAAVLAYLFQPLYAKLTKLLPSFLPKESVAAFLTCLVIIMIVLIPMTMVSVFVAQEAKDGYNHLEQLLQSSDFKLELPAEIKDKVGDLSRFKGPLISMGSQAIVWVQNIVTKIPNAILNIFITIFSIYFFLREAKNIGDFIQCFFPLPPGRYKQIFKRFNDLSRGVILGQVVVGIVQGILAWAGFFFLGVPNAILLGFLTAIISIIPLFGAAMVWLPVDIYLFGLGYLAGGEYWRALTLLAYGMFVISTIDNILKPKIVGDRANVHPLIILFGIIGGIQLFGLPGILLGPMILMSFDVIMEMFRELY
ncbi:AI-2E family transporter [Candidatus Saganbacteria bacterium]|nr:AI-2E family transporter [Candidatus Saganbacteria bacterium]